MSSHLIIGRRPSSFRRDDSIGVASEQKPAQWRVSAVVRPRPPNDGLVAGAGESHIQQTQVFSPLLLLMKPLAVSEPDTLASDVDCEGVVVVRVVENRHRNLRLPAVPKKRAVDDGELEALAPVDREHLHGFCIGLEAKASILVVTIFAGLGNSSLQPARERGRSQILLDGGCMEEPADMQEIRHQTLA